MFTDVFLEKLTCPSQHGELHVPSLSEISVHFDQTTRLHMPEDSSFEVGFFCVFEKACRACVVLSEVK
jgi:hypothetical protein